MGRLPGVPNRGTAATGPKSGGEVRVQIFWSLMAIASLLTMIFILTRE
jgi:hypothetical protein